MSNYVSIESVKEKLDIDKPIDIHNIYKIKKKKLADKIRRQDPEKKKRRNELEKIRITIKRQDPEYVESVNQKSRIRYAKNPGPQIECSTKWNQNHKERRNANQRASYARNRDYICTKIREKRRLKREANQ